MAIEKALRWIALGGIFALPFVCLIVAGSLFFPYITGKNFAFRLIVEVVTGAWLALALVNPAYRPRRNWILAAFAVFVLIIAIADAQGVNAFKSFWSNYERMDGWVTLAHLFAYLAVAMSMLNTEKLWRRFWQVSIAVSVVLSLYGLLQVAGALALGQPGPGGLAGRIDATFGNPIYLAVYMLFHVFLAALLWYDAWHERRPGARMPVSLWYGSVIVLDTFALFLTGTRGTMIGIVGGAFVAGLIYVLKQRDAVMVRRVFIGGTVGLVLAGGLLWLARDTAFVHSVGFLDRLASISLSEGTTEARFLNMGIAWQGVKERPILGWGQENYAIVFDKYYDPRMYAAEPWFDRVHNIIFDWLVAGGFLGLISYLAIFVAALMLLWRSMFTTAQRAILTGLLAGYFFHNLFVFDNVTSYILFASVLAYIAWRGTGDVRAYPPLFGSLQLPQRMLPVVAALAVVGTLGAAWGVNGAAFAQNKTLIAAIQQQQGGAMQNLELFKKAISYQSAGTQEAREQLAQFASRVAGTSALDLPTKQAYFDVATSEMMKQAQEVPLDARFPLFLGIMLGAYGDFKDAAVALEKALELSPRKQGILFQIAQNQQAQGDHVGALETYRRAYELAPDFRDARLNYAAAAARLGRQQLADELLAPLKDSGAAADVRITAVYVELKRYDKVVELWEPFVKAQPNNPQGYYTVAAGYFGMGNTAKAIATLQTLIIAVPSEKQKVESIIQQIRAGNVQL